MPVEKITIGKAFKVYIQEVLPRKAESTQAIEKIYIKKLYDYLFDERVLTNIDEVGLVDLESYQTHLIKRVSAATVNREFNLIKDMFDRFRRWRYIESDPAKDVERLSEDSEEYALWTPGDLKRLIAMAEMKVCTQWVTNVVLGLYYTGLRPGQLASLDFKDVDYENEVVWTKSKKGGKWRKYPIPLSQNLRDLVDSIRLEFRSQNLKCSGAIFVNSRGERFTPNSLNRVIRKLRTKIGNDKLCAYGLRHTFGHSMHTHGVDLKSVSELMGHARITTTQRYTRRDDKRLRLLVNDAFDRLSDRPHPRPQPGKTGPNLVRDAQRDKESIL